MTLDLDALEALANAASPGPWSHEVDDDPPDVGICADGCLVAIVHSHANLQTSIRLGTDFNHDDARFIATARTAIPQLISELRRAREELDFMRTAACQSDARRELAEVGLEAARRVVAAAQAEHKAHALDDEAESCPVCTALDVYYDNFDRDPVNGRLVAAQAGGASE